MSKVLILSKLTPPLREILSKPHGIILKGAQQKITQHLKNYVINSNKYLITVGDVVTLTCISNGIIPKVSIMDLKTLRKEENLLKLKLSDVAEHFNEVLYVENPPGYINLCIVDKLKRILNKPGKFLVIVKGEEDLLILPILLFSPLGAKVIYGIPNVGVGVFIVTKEIISIVKSIVENFELSIKA